MNFKKFMDMYDNWNGIIRINDDNLNVIIEGKTVDIIETRKDLYDKEVVAFGFYDGVLCIRVAVFETAQI